MNLRFLPLLAGLLLLPSAIRAAEADFYVGTYTKEGVSKGIYHYRLDLESGQVSGGELAAEAANPSFLAVHPGGKFLYAAMEKEGGVVGSFAIQPDGKLKLLSEKSSKGVGNCHVTVDPAGKNVFAANYGSGSVAVLPIQEDGRVGEATGFHQHTGGSINPQRQTGPHAHSIYADPAGRFVYSCDLGTDRIDGYQLDPGKGTVTLDENASGNVPPGSGPRHLAFHPRGDFVYVINELRNTVSVFRRDAAKGALSLLQTVSTLPADFTGRNSTAEIFVHPSGKFLYGSNRGHDSIACFAIAADGQLAPAGHTPSGGKTPRNFALDPTGRWLLAAHQKTNDIFIFKLDPATGQLTPTGQRLERAAAVCVMFVPTEGGRSPKSRPSF